MPGKTEEASIGGDDDEEKEGIHKKEKSHQLHSGYAITPGLFDEYLKVQDELGDVLDTNTRMQYRAAMATKSTPKVSDRGVRTFREISH